MKRIIDKYKRIYKRQASTIGAYAIFFIISLAILSLAFNRAIDKNISSQNIMLCNSAKISQNKKYLKICDCYYQNQNIDCINN